MSIVCPKHSYSVPVINSKTGIYFQKKKKKNDYSNNMKTLLENRKRENSPQFTP